MRRGAQLLVGLATAAALVAGCGSSDPIPEPAADDLVSSTSSSTILPAETTTPRLVTTTTTAPTATTSTRPSEFDEDVELIMDLYGGWSQAVAIGQDEIEAYFAAHLYPDLPDCAAGEKTLPIYTAQRETIQRANNWAITWGPLNGVHPDGRVYEVQLAELDSPSHVAILHGVAYVFWNCNGNASATAWYAASVSVDEWGTMRAGSDWSDSTSGGFFGSGCSPGSESLPEGVWYGRIAETRANSVAFDLYCMGPPPANSEEWSFTIINNSPKIRDVPIGATTQVFAIALDGGHEVQPYSSWYQTPHPRMFCPDEGCWDVVLFVNRSQATEIIQTWSP